MKVTSEDSVPPLPAVLVLQDAGVHVSTIDSHDIASNIETLINECLSCQTTLWVLYVYLDDYYIRFWGNFDNIWFRYYIDIIKNVSWFDNWFYYFRVDKHVSTFYSVRNTEDL